jgi:hypothetical protein
VVLAWLLRRRGRFVVVTTIAAGLSLIPAIAAADDLATAPVLVATHLIAAAIIITMLSQQLPIVRAVRRAGVDDRAGNRTGAIRG